MITLARVNENWNSRSSRINEEAQWKTMRGAHILVDDDGKIVAGPNPNARKKQASNKKATTSEKKKTNKEVFAELAKKYDAYTVTGDTIIEGDKLNDIDDDLIKQGYERGNSRTWRTGRSHTYSKGEDKIEVETDEFPRYDRDGVIYRYKKKTFITLK